MNLETAALTMESEVENTREQIRGFLARSLGHAALADEDDIFTVGGATSLFAMELVMFVEGTFGIQLDDGDLIRQNFDSINSLVRLVAAKRKTPSRQ